MPLDILSHQFQQVEMQRDRRGLHTRFGECCILQTNSGKSLLRTLRVDGQTAHGSDNCLKLQRACLVQYRRIGWTPGRHRKKTRVLDGKRQARVAARNIPQTSFASFVVDC